MERSILVPLDGTPAAMAALPHALGLAARFGAELCLVTVCDPSELPLDATGKRWDFLHAMGARLGARTRILSGNPAQEIVREASFLEPELIVMGTRAEAAPRTVAEAVMRGAHCPVLIVPDPGGPRGGAASRGCSGRRLSPLPPDHPTAGRHAERRHESRPRVPPGSP